MNKLSIHNTEWAHINYNSHLNVDLSSKLAIIVSNHEQWCKSHTLSFSKLAFHHYRDHFTILSKHVQLTKSLN